jgi:hypothetical protein
MNAKRFLPLDINLKGLRVHFFEQHMSNKDENEAGKHHKDGPKKII